MPPRIRRLDDAGEAGGTPSWIDSLPFVTKYWFLGTLGLTILGNIGVIPIMQLYWDFTLVKQKFQLWRILTPFLFVGSFSFPTAITLMLQYQYSSQYEKSSVYNTGAGGGTADYATMLIFGIVGTLLSTMFVGMEPFFAKNMVYFVLYVWSKRNPTDRASIWGLPVGAAMLPFAVLGLNLIMGNPWVEIAHGIGMGHIYYFLVDIVPQVYGMDLIHTPDFLINFFGTGQYEAAPPTTTVGSGMYGGGSGGGGGFGSGSGGGDRPTGGGGSSTSGGYNWGNGGRALGRE